MRTHMIALSQLESKEAQHRNGEVSTCASIQVPMCHVSKPVASVSHRRHTVSPSAPPPHISYPWYCTVSVEPTVRSRARSRSTEAVKKGQTRRTRPVATGSIHHDDRRLLHRASSINPIFTPFLAYIVGKRFQFLKSYVSPQACESPTGVRSSCQCCGAAPNFLCHRLGCINSSNSETPPLGRSCVKVQLCGGVVGWSGGTAATQRLAFKTFSNVIPTHSVPPRLPTNFHARIPSTY